MSNDLILSIRFDGDGKGLVEAVSGSTEQLKKFVNNANKSDTASQKAAKGQEGLAASSKKASKMGKRLNKTYKRLSKTLVSTLAAYAGIRGAQIALEAFEQQEQAVAALDQSINSMGRTTDGLSKKLQSLASQIQQEGILGDEALIEGQSFLATYSEITDDLLPRSTRVMADLAAKMGGDLVSAANTVGKASMGMVGELSRIGITLSDAAKESKDFELILSEIEAQVGGMNTALAATSTGGIKQFKNAWGDVVEVAGEFIASGLSDYLRGISVTIGELLSVQDREEQALRTFNELIKPNIDLLRDYGVAVAVIDTSSLEDINRLLLAAKLNGIDLKAEAPFRHLEKEIKAVTLSYGGMQIAVANATKTLGANSEAVRRLTEQEQQLESRIALLVGRHAALAIARDNEAKKTDQLGKSVKDLSDDYGVMDEAFDLIEKQFEDLDSAEAKAFAGLNKVSLATKNVGKAAIQMADEWDIAFDLIEQQFVDLDAAEARNIAGLTEFKNSGKEAFSELTSATKSWGSQFSNTLADLVISGKADFSSLANSIIKDLLRIYIQQQLIGPLFNKIGLIEPDGTAAAVQHTGGVVGRTGSSRTVSKAIFSGAPRYHNGGIAGDEVPTILKRGEEVLPENSPRHIKNQGASQSGNVRVELINRSNSPLKATAGNARFDAQGMMLSVVIDDLDRDGPFTQKLRSTHNLQRVT